MGERGPKPLPGNVHMLRGNPSKKPLASLLDDVVRPDVSLPECPEWLPEEARAEWARFGEHLATLGLVAEIDRAALTAYCTAWSDLVWVEQRIAALNGEDPTGEHARITSIAAGSRKLSALVQLKYLVLERLTKYAAEFGASPSARSRVTAGDPRQPELPGFEPKPHEGGWGAFK